ncbi:hypothetical protein AZ78_4039 [Lysobacter capsici AZ78]|uniref:Uncharacterized protein n=1 Tax=Lysobacter capsici AZ78 TaxID=1444315 RepID=A0A120AHP4_9GAMM|nr:hypothetical protein AZ78_4039 [Lysobacter capsici AZ78]
MGIGVHGLALCVAGLAALASAVGPRRRKGEGCSVAAHAASAGQRPGHDDRSRR